MIYHYERWTWVNGKFKGKEDFYTTSTTLYQTYGKQGLVEFLLLLNTWNGWVCSNGLTEGKTIYKYVFKKVE